MIEIQNLTGNRIDESFFQKIEEKVLKGEKKEGKISLALVGPARMRKLNKKFGKKNRITDLLSFSQAEVPFEKWKIDNLQKTKDLGEIVICLREVKKSARRLNIPFEKELARVFIHGILHLLGYDHQTPGEEKKMGEKEEKYGKSLD